MFSLFLLSLGLLDTLRLLRLANLLTAALLLLLPHLVASALLLLLPYLPALLLFLLLALLLLLHLLLALLFLLLPKLLLLCLPTLLLLLLARLLLLLLLHLPALLLFLLLAHLLLLLLLWLLHLPVLLLFLLGPHLLLHLLTTLLLLLLPELLLLLHLLAPLLLLGLKAFCGGTSSALAGLLNSLRPSSPGLARPLDPFPGPAPHARSFARTPPHTARLLLDAFLCDGASPYASRSFRPFSGPSAHSPLALQAFRLPGSPSPGPLRTSHQTFLRTFLAQPLAPAPSSRTPARSTGTFGAQRLEALQTLLHLGGDLLLSLPGKFHAPNLRRPFSGKCHGFGLGKASCIKGPEVRGLDNGPWVAQLTNSLFRASHLHGPGAGKSHRIFGRHDFPEIWVAVKDSVLRPTAPHIIHMDISDVVVDGNIVDVGHPGDIRCGGSPAISTQRHAAPE